MINKRIIYVLIAASAVLLSGGWLYNKHQRQQYSSMVPGIKNPTKAISVAIDEARLTPSAENLGKLGMLYHANALYTEASDCYELAHRRDRKAWLWLYYQGYMATEMGASEQVVESFSRLVNKHPDNHHAWYYLGEGYRNLGQAVEAEKALDGLRDIKNSDSRDYYPLSSYAGFQLARIYLQSDRADKAESILKQILEEHPTFGPAYRLLAAVYSSRGEEVLARKSMLRANDLLVYSPPVDTLVDRLTLLSTTPTYVMKKIDEAQRNLYSEWARELCDYALTSMPDEHYILSKTLSIYIWLGDQERVNELIPKHLAYYKDDFKELSNTGRDLFRKYMHEPAITYLGRAAELEPVDIENNELLALAYWFTGDKDKAHSSLYQIEQQHPGDLEARARVATVLYYNFKEKEKGSSYLASLQRAGADGPYLHKLAGGVAEANGDIRGAIYHYQAAFRANPDDVSSMRFLGTSLTNREMWPEAIAHYRECLELKPNDPYFQERLGTLLSGCPDKTLRDQESAAFYLERAFLNKVSSLEDQVYAGRRLAYAYANMREMTEALKTIEQTIRIAHTAGFSEAFLAELQQFRASLR